MMIRLNRFWKYGAILLFLTLLISSFSTVVYSYESVFIHDFDEKQVSNIEFYYFSDSSEHQDEKSLLKVKKVQQTQLISSMNIDPYESKNIQYQDQTICDLKEDNTNYVSLDPKDAPWPMKCHDNHHTGKSLYSTANNNGAELWKFKTNAWIEGGPILDDDGTIYFADDMESLYALNPDGSLKWIFDNFEDGSSITSTPSLAEDGTIYIGSWDHYFYAINPDGTLNWKFEVGRYASIIGSSAIGFDGTIYFGTTGLTNNNKEIGRIFALNPDGSEKWCYQTDYKISSSPAIADDGTIYIGSGDTYLYAMNPNGTLKWRYKTGHYIKGPPSIADDGTVYFGSYDDYIYALYSNGTMKWKCKVGFGTESNPSIGLDGTIYVGGKKLYAVNPDGSLKWAFDLNNDEIIFQSSPAISAEGIIYVGTYGEGYGDIIAVNPDGTLRWRNRIANRWVDSSPCISSEGFIYIGSSSNLGLSYFYALGPGDVNNPPNCPKIDGSTSGKSGDSYSYVINGSDPDGDMISYFVEWGDDSDSGWQGPYHSGMGIEMTHTWSTQGYYTIKAKVKDEQGAESNWATLEVSMPRIKPLDLLFSRFLCNHPKLSLFYHLMLD